jgi:hypothetical protein
MAGARLRRPSDSLCSRAKPRASTRTCTRLGLLCLPALLLTGVHGEVRADARPANVPDSPLARWLPTPEARAAREQLRLAQALEALLAQLPGVEHARAVVSVPAVDVVRLDRSLPPVRATLVVEVRAGGADEARLEALARGVLPPGALVHLSRSEAAPAPRGHGSGRVERAPGAATRVGPFQVEARSAGWLRVTLGMLLVSNALLAGLVLARRARR